MVCTAFSMSCTLTHSCREWNACSPAKILGQGSPMNDSREPSVPPRIALFTGVKPGAADRLDGVVDDLGVGVDLLFHVAILRLDFHPVGGMRKVLHHLLDDIFQQRLFFPQSLVGEIAHDEAEGRLLQRAGNAKSDAGSLALPSVVSGEQVVFRQAVDDGSGDLDRVLHLAFGKAGMGADALDGDGGGIGGEGLVLDIAGGLAVDGVGKIGAELLQVDLVDAAADLLIGGEQDLDGAVLDLRDGRSGTSPRP